MKQFILYGFGGHGRVVKDAIEKNGASVIHIFDQEHPYDASMFPDIELIIAIGNNEVRKNIAAEIVHPLGIVIHPMASIAQEVTIGKGTVILANAVIQTGSTIGDNCIINANTTIDHDAIIEDFVSIYAGAYIGGGAKITEGKTIEPNAVIKRNTFF
ncbi:transferase [Flavobacterium sp. I3-2]|uniref:PglD-related sugar-binding protein n=1 Tax=Flavobacterium sp. I3-2 TaxID=2748319 RepID=UPI0015A77E84|nr:transferase [Flavobacterium sp. I3-2]